MKQWTIVGFLLLWLGWHLSLPVDLVHSDLGRHIKNGELLWQGHAEILSHNFYSYNCPRYPFINYQWLFGVFCFVLWHMAGFVGLSLVYLILELLTFYLFFRIWQRYATFSLACAGGLLCFPLICLRTEVRPEGISYLFLALFWYLIDSWQQKKTATAFLFSILCLLQILWANTHVFFILGPLLTILFCFQDYIDGKMQEARRLLTLFVLLLAACFINPFGAKIFLVPFEAWGQQSAFQITESLSVILALQAGLLAALRPLLIYFLLVMGSLTAVLLYLIKREGLKKYIFSSMLLIIVGIAGFNSLRMIELFGFCCIPLSMYVVGRLLQKQSIQFRKSMEALLIVVGTIVSLFINTHWQQDRRWGILPEANDAAQFFKQAKIKGPIFNNYSIGSYLIFHLSPQQQVFVDNRGLAAYPPEFFVKTFIPLQKNDDVWHRLDKKYHFNVIFYAPDVADWDEGFIWRRLNDPTWALVFHNKETVIFLKCNPQNQRLFSQPLCRS